jgi:hypothetical protein
LTGLILLFGEFLKRVVGAVEVEMAIVLDQQAKVVDHLVRLPLEEAVDQFRQLLEICFQWD